MIGWLARMFLRMGVPVSAALAVGLSGFWSAATAAEPDPAAALNAKIKALEKEIQAKDREIAGLKKQVSDLQAENRKQDAAQDKELRKKDAEIASLKKQVADLQAENKKQDAAQDKELRKKDAEIADLKKQSADLKKQVDSLKAQITRLQDPKTQDERVKQLEAENRRLKSSMDGEVRKRDQQIDSLKKDLADARAQIAKLNDAAAKSAIDEHLRDQAAPNPSALQLRTEEPLREYLTVLAKVAELDAASTDRRDIVAGASEAFEKKLDDQAVAILCEVKSAAAGADGTATVTLSLERARQRLGILPKDIATRYVLPWIEGDETVRLTVAEGGAEAFSAGAKVHVWGQGSVVKSDDAKTPAGWRLRVQQSPDGPSLRVLVIRNIKLTLGDRTFAAAE